MTLLFAYLYQIAAACRADLIEIAGPTASLLGSLKAAGSDHESPESIAA
jgi:hypothetical protein